MVKLRILLFRVFFFYYLRSALLSLTFWEKADPIRPGDAVQGGPGDPVTRCFQGSSLSLSLSLHLGSTTVLLACSRARAYALSSVGPFFCDEAFGLCCGRRIFLTFCVSERVVYVQWILRKKLPIPPVLLQHLSLSLLHAYAHKSLFPGLKNTVDPFVD